MKLKKYHYVLIAVAIIFIMVVSFGGKSDYYEKYKNYEYAFFPHYSTINNKLSEKDKEIADSIIHQATLVFNFTGERKPEKDVGALERYYFTDPEIQISKVDLKIKPIAGKFNNTGGYLWVVYSVERTDNTGEIVNGSWDIPCRWEAEKQKDGNWKVVDIDEPA